MKIDWSHIKSLHARIAASLKSMADHSAGRSHDAEVPKLYHLAAAAWIISMLLLGYFKPDRYYELLQEDRAVEWSTVGVFAAAAVLRLVKAIPHRRVFDVLVALFCLFVAGEEFSWGQRLLGFEGPEYFLAHNYQQEVNLHNLPGSFVGPKWILIGALTGYGLLLPLLSRSERATRILKFAGATPPPLQLLPWFAASIALLVWYPLTLTGEWVELLAGSLFLVASRTRATRFWLALSIAVVFGIAMTRFTEVIESRRDIERTECATKEVQSLLDNITLAGGALSKLLETESVHKRIWTAVNEGYLNGELVLKFRGIKCEGGAEQNAANRRKYAVDPWGSPYWLFVEEIDSEEQRVTVYSFGPNRRRDGREEDGSWKGSGGDDVVAAESLFWPVE